jgi:hypothetical protein
VGFQFEDLVVKSETNTNILNSTMMLRILLVLAWLTPLAVARMGNVYPLKERRTQDTTELTMDEFINLDLTFSDDSPAKELQAFYLDLLETDGNLPGLPSLILVELSLDRYILEELTAVYGINNAIEVVNTTIVSQEAITRSGSADVPTLGSRLETQVNIMFENEPSPEVEAVEELLKEIMQNMTYYVTNLTVWATAAEDDELSRVHTVTRVEVIRTPTTVTGVETNDETDIEDNGAKLSLLIPVIAAGVVLFAVIALLATRRRERIIVVAPVVEPRKRPLDVEVYMDDDNSDNFSFETSLAESPKKNNSTLIPGVSSPATSAGNARGDDESDMFSGIDCQTSPSPRNSGGRSVGGRSVFSFLSGVRGSSSTVAASNTTQANAKARKYSPSEITEARIAAGAPVLGVPVEDTMSPSGTPKSRASLFSFSDGDEEDTSLWGIDEVPSDEETSDRVDEQEAAANNESLLVLLSSDSTEFGPRPVASPASPSSVDFSRLLSDNENSGFASNASQSPSVIKPTALESSAQQDNSMVNQSDSSASACENMKCLPTCGGDTKAAVSSEEIIQELAMGTDTNVNVIPSAAAFDSRPGSTKSATSINSTMPTPMIQNTKSSKSQYGGYQSDPGSNTPERPRSRPGTGSDVIQLDWGDKSKSQALRNAARAADFVSSIAPLSPASSEEDFDGNGRRHAKSTTADGTSKYQGAAMQPTDWSLTSYDGGSVSGSEISQTEAASLAIDQIQGITGVPGSDKKVWKRGSSKQASTPPPKIPRSPKSPGTPKSLNLSIQSNESAASASQQLITDLVWLEKKISNSNAAQPQPQVESPRQSAPGIVQTDSLSFQSGTDSYDSTINLGTPSSTTRRGGMQAIVCRDCFAPPGKLKIVIHSTKDGPAVHTVKKGSSLEGHIFPGDLIISVDNVDTRSYTAEQVMKIMTTKTRFERKITVLHFEDDSSSTNMV